MGRKKKRAAPNPYDRIFCYYCDRTFQNEQELLMHQREKHLRCPSCNKRMLSVPSLMIHASQMHNLTLSAVPNAVPGRDATDIDVLGMKGIPDEYYSKLEGRRKVVPVTERSSSAPRSTAAHVQHPVAQQPVTHPPQAQWSWPVYSSGPWSVAHNPMSFYTPSPSSVPLPPIAGVPPHPNMPVFTPYHQSSGISPVSSHIPTPANLPAHVPAPYPYGAGSYPPVSMRPHRAHQLVRPERGSFKSHKTLVTSQTTHPSSVQQSVAPGQVSVDANENTAAGSRTTAALISNQYPRFHSQDVASSGSTLSTRTRNSKEILPPPASAVTSETKLVFDAIDLSMEELRAQLPRYRIKDAK